MKRCRFGSLAPKPTTHSGKKKDIFHLIYSIVFQRMDVVVYFLLLCRFFLSLSLVDDGPLQNAWRPFACVGGIDHVTLEYGRIGKPNWVERQSPCGGVLTPRHATNLFILLLFHFMQFFIKGSAQTVERYHQFYSISSRIVDRIQQRRRRRWRGGQQHGLVSSLPGRSHGFPQLVRPICPRFTKSSCHSMGGRRSCAQYPRSITGWHVKDA